MEVTNDNKVLAGANELGTSKEQVTNDVVELVKKRVSLGPRHRPEIVKSAPKEAIRCPLELVCYPSCFWWKDGKCIFPRKTK